MSTSKSDLITQIATANNITKTEAENTVSIFLNALTNAIKNDGEVKLVGFGNFKVKDRPARQGRNPHTGEAIQIAASRAVGFKASKTLLD